MITDLLETKAYEVPALPDNWEFQRSVTIVKGFVYKWKNLIRSEGMEILRELDVANRILAYTPSEAVSVRYLRDANAPRKTWEQYCQGIGVDKSTVNRWLRSYRGEAKELDEMKKEKSHVHYRLTPARLDSLRAHTTEAWRMLNKQHFKIVPIPKLRIEIKALMEELEKLSPYGRKKEDHGK